MNKIDTKKILKELNKFREDRDWEKFHTLKNLVCGLNVESAELLEHFIWEELENTEKLDENKRKEIAREIADIFNHILLISQKLNIDLEKTALEKIKENCKKYPIEKTKGNSNKYDKY